MKRLLVVLVVLFLFGCEQTITERCEKWKTIEVGDYFFDFPADFKLFSEQGIDSYVGKVQGDSMCFAFDFGYYSNDLGQTLQEYLENGFWRNALAYHFMEDGIIYDRTNTPKVEVMSIRPARMQDSTIGAGCDYVARCKHDKTEFDFPVYIPKEIKQTNYSIDTVDNQYRRIVWAKDPEKGTTGIYLRDINSFNESINSCLALSMATANLTRKQQEIALEIFKSGRHKREEK